MTIAYFDCFSGIAGDMVLGAMIDAGLPLPYLKKTLSRLPVGGYELVRKNKKGAISGTNLHVITKKELGRSDYRTIRALINRSRLSSQVKLISLAIFERLAEAESSIHGVSKERAHFHEVGAVDSIIDIVGSSIGFEYFGFDEIYSSPLPITRGRIRSAHGLLPVPAPATLYLIKGVPLEKAPVKDEIVTPTGAAIITTVARQFGECPLQKIEKIGYGFGDKTFPGIPNALRLMIGEGYPVVVIEANIDDMNPQIFDYVMERLFKAGAVDVALLPVQMKKNRPGIILHCQSPWDKKEKMIDIILRETTTIGVRYYPAERKVLTRELKVVRTKAGKMKVKIAKDEHGKIVKVIPEYEDLKRLARKTKRSIIDILGAAKPIS
jgi:hypothetical protein